MYIYKYSGPGYCGYFAETAMFLWLLVINYELWRAATTLQFRSSRMFRKYNIFVWSVATTLLAITGTMEFLTRHGDGDSPFQPGVGNNFCWINSKQNDLCYLRKHNETVVL